MGNLRDRPIMQRILRGAAAASSHLFQRHHFVDRATHMLFSTKQTAEAVQQNIQKKPTAVAARKGTTRHKRPLTMHYKHHIESGLPQVNCVPVAECFCIDELLDDDEFKSRYSASQVDGAEKIALHCREEQRDDKIRDFFVFSDGVVVFWNMDNQSQVIELLKKHQIKPFAKELIQDEEETMSFDFASGPSHTDDSTIYLNAEQHHRTDAPTRNTYPNAELERFAFSHAMAASVRMGIWEQSLDELDAEVHKCVQALKDDKLRIRWFGEISYSDNTCWDRKKSLNMIGKFADIRHSVNSTDLLSKDIYWDLPEMERAYNSLSKRLCLNSRRNMINERIGYCEYFSKTVHEVLNSSHSHFLEVIIILLIAVECLHIFSPIARWIYEKLERR